eukprot:scaffold75203_cov33-Tisochrysis_lutea.AAC.3
MAPLPCSPACERRTCGSPGSRSPRSSYVRDAGRLSLRQKDEILASSAQWALCVRMQWQDSGTGSGSSCVQLASASGVG